MQKTQDFTVGTEMVGFSKGSVVFLVGNFSVMFNLLSQDVGAGDDLIDSFSLHGVSNRKIGLRKENMNYFHS